MFAWFLFFVTVAQARPKSEAEEAARAAAKGPAASAADIPALAALLKKAQWEPTPELSGVFKAGNLFEVTTLGHRPLATNCIEAPPQENTYTSAELVTSLQAGVSIGSPMASGGAYAGILKKVKFGTPTQVSIPRLDMELTAACKEKLSKMPAARIQSAYVVQEVLKAEIAEQTCGKVDANGRFVGLGSAEVDFAAACAQASLEPVAVGYRTIPLAELMGIPVEAPLAPVAAAVADLQPSSAIAQIQAAKALEERLGQEMEACINTKAQALRTQASREAVDLVPILRDNSRQAHELGSPQVRRFIERYGAAEAVCTNELGEGHQNVDIPELVAMRAWMETPPDSSGPPLVARQIANLSEAGASSEWDVAVKGLMIGAYDANHDGAIGSADEVKAVPCEVWTAINEGIKSGGSMGMRVTYGFDEGFGYVGASLGIDPSQRTAAQKRAVGCGVDR